GVRRESARRPSRLAAFTPVAAAGVRPGAMGGHDRIAGVDAADGGAAERQRHPARAGSLGLRRPARLAVLARATGSSPAPLLLTAQTQRLPSHMRDDHPSYVMTCAVNIG